jgi:hypothetical protein
MERSLIIRLGIAGSVLAHFLVVAVIFLSTDVHPFEQAAPEPVAVDIVDSDEPEKTPEPNASPTPDLALPEKSGASSSPAAAQAAATPAQQPMQPQPAPSREAAAQSQPQQPQPQPQQQQSQPQQPAPSPTPSRALGYIPAAPDVTVKYGVMLGLPAVLPPLAPSGEKRDDDKDGGPSATTNLSVDLVTVFRNHLRSCSRLPSSISPADKVMVKLRVVMAPDGRLAAEPDLIEVKSPIKGVDLKQSVVSALMACQPYTMLPPDRYGEWKVLELSFTPQDFGG